MPRAVSASWLGALAVQVRLRAVLCSCETLWENKVSVAKNTLGKTGLTVSPICFGTAALGDMPDTFGYSVDAERARSTIRAIFDSSVNFLDTARLYGMGRAGSGSAR